MTDKEESLSTRLGRKLNGDEAVRLQLESNQEFYKGNVGTSLKLHLQSAASGAEHLGNLIGTEVKGAVASAKTFIEANPGAAIGAVAGPGGVAVGYGIQKAISGGEEVKEHGAAPATPAKAATPAQPKR